MTTAMDATSPFSRARNGDRRRSWAATTLQRWMNLTHFAVVVVDATVRSASELQFLRAFGPASRLEILAMPPASQPLHPGQSKGYLEAQQIRYAAFGGSRLLAGCSHFAHATGNRFIANAELLLGSAASVLRASIVGVPRASTSDLIRWRSPTRPWVDSSFVLWTRPFLRRYFDHNAISELPAPLLMSAVPSANGTAMTVPASSNAFEVVLARAVLSAHAAGETISWLNCLHVVGWSGTRGTQEHRPCAPRAASLVQVTGVRKTHHQELLQTSWTRTPARTAATTATTTASSSSSGGTNSGAGSDGGVASASSDSDAVGTTTTSADGTSSGDAPPAPTSCETAVDPVDPSPIRSPQAVHTRLLRRFAGRDVVEIGTRHGDGLMCFARVTRSIVAVESDPIYCARLRHRIAAAAAAAAATTVATAAAAATVATAAAAGAAAAASAAAWPAGKRPRVSTSLPNVSVRCAPYQEPRGLPDAAVYTWWQAVPRLTNEAVIARLALLQRHGHVRREAEAVIMFDERHTPDVTSLRRLRRRFRWSERVAFDEVSLCLHRLPPGHPSRHWCPRARGTFTVAGLMPIDFH